MGTCFYGYLVKQACGNWEWYMSSGVGFSYIYMSRIIQIFLIFFNSLRAHFMIRLFFETLLLSSFHFSFFGQCDIFRQNANFLFRKWDSWFFFVFGHFDKKTKNEMNNLFVTSKNGTTNSPIHEFKVLHKGQRAFWNLWWCIISFLLL